MGTTRRFPRITCGPRWFQRESCWEINGFLVDPGLDLPGAVDQFLLGEVVDDELPIVGRVAPGRQPRGQVVLLAGRERDEEDELLLLLTR
jgi:hypothetical protein